MHGLQEHPVRIAVDDAGDRTIRLVADRIVALRDGRLVSNVRCSEVDHDGLVRIIAGREIAAVKMQHHRKGGVALTARALSTETLRDVARSIPLERMVIETDSPYGAPQAYRGKRNEPAYVVEAAKKIAEVRGVSTDAVAETTSRTALRLLGTAVSAATTSRG